MNYFVNLASIKWEKVLFPWDYLPQLIPPDWQQRYSEKKGKGDSGGMNGPSGNVIRSIRLTVTANCPMSLHTVICWLDCQKLIVSISLQFPLDKQICPLEIEVVP